MFSLNVSLQSQPVIMKPSSFNSTCNTRERLVKSVSSKRRAPVEICKETNLFVTNTMFDYKQMKGKSINDLFLVDQLKGTELEINHYLVVALDAPRSTDEGGITGKSFQK